MNYINYKSLTKNDIEQFIKELYPSCKPKRSIKLYVSEREYDMFKWILCDEITSLPKNDIKYNEWLKKKEE